MYYIADNLEIWHYKAGSGKAFFNDFFFNLYLELIL